MGEIASDDPTAQPTATDVLVESTQTPEPEPTPTATPQPTPVSAHVTIHEQALDESGKLLAAEVSLPAPGWLAIYNAIDDEPGEVIGRVPLTAGVHENVSVTVDTDLATEKLYAGVHLDVGAEGVFEYPGEDEPYPNEPEAEFVVDLQLPQPQIDMVDQSIAENGILTIARVELLEPSWVLIHTDVDGEIGGIVGSLFLEEGMYEEVPIAIDWRRATPILHAVIHADDGKARLMEYPDGDLPILVNGKPVVSEFRASYPPEVLVYDQPVIEGSVTIERAISEGPGWIAIYNENEGQPGFIIGNAPLEDGLNIGVTVELLQSGITPRLFARIHQDTEPGDAFNFPGQDPPVLYNNRLPNAAAFRTDNGAFAFIDDQRVGNNETIQVATIVSTADGWATIFADEDGQPGDRLGQTWFPAGVNRNVGIELETIPPSGRLILVLYQDLGDAEEFEDGIDLPLSNDDNRPIRIPFVIR